MADAGWLEPFGSVTGVRPPVTWETIVPSGYPSYIRLFHTIIEEDTECRIRWEALAEQAGLEFSADIHCRSLQAAFGGWDKWIDRFAGPDEGELDVDSAQRVVRDLTSVGYGSQLMIYHWFPFPFPLTLRGSLADLEAHSASGDRFGPNYVWPLDRSCLCTPYDETSTWIASSRYVAQTLLDDPDLETVQYQS